MNAEFTAMIARNNWVVLDTETTGLDKPAEICQIAIVSGPRGVVLIDEFIKPVRPIPPAATAIHGITDEMVEGARTWAQLVPIIQDVIRGKDVVVYNAVYDRKLMHWSDEAAGLEHIEWKALGTWYCAMEAYAEHHGEINSFYGSYKWQKLSDAMRQQDLPVSDAHSALGDALMTRALVMKICGNELPAEPVFDPEASLDPVGIPADLRSSMAERATQAVLSRRLAVIKLLQIFAAQVDAGFHDPIIGEMLHKELGRIDNNGQVERRA